ncbi:hypothetical protein F5883DRAFT_372667, partial [Diaporthe sp. PMI_573]
LTRLFLDAGILTANLDIKFLWIDSICIIQGNLSDWDKEATLMAGYYQHAWITISATPTENGGFLRPSRDMGSIPPISRLPYRNKEGKQDGYFYLQDVSSSIIDDQFLDGISRSDLLRRGWVLQEWILSPRIICFSNLVPFLIWSGLNKKRAFAFATWRRIIMRSSGLELTEFETDKLVSLAGIAREVGKALQSLSAAGI